MKPSPEDLEKFVHRALREMPNRSAPRTLEMRVLAELERRAALPWWRQSFAHWPAAMRSVFLVISAAAAAILIGGLFLVMRNPETAQMAGAVSARFGWLLVLRSMVDGAQGTAGVVFRAIPPLWLYGSLAFLGVCYATVIGVGAAAYRFYSARQ